MGKCETLAGLLTLLAGLIGAPTASLELAKVTLGLRRARRAGRSVI